MPHTTVETAANCRPRSAVWAARARTLAFVYFVVLFTATHLPSTPSSIQCLSDKVLHTAAYLMLTLSVLTGWELTIGGLQPKHFFAVWLVGTVYGAFDEFTQIPVGRTCDIHDWVADVIGIVSGLILFTVVRAGVYRLAGATSLGSSSAGASA
ncbi:MAG: VanZ family protein [Planctomycetales bacterium]|nr:VanZ family protein [Planctomycetales bacterium]